MNKGDTEKLIDDILVNTYLPCSSRLGAGDRERICKRFIDTLNDKGLVIVPKERLSAISWALARWGQYQGSLTKEEIIEMRDVLGAMINNDGSGEG